MFKSKNHLKALSVLLLTAVAFSLLQFSEVKAATANYSENFGATTYKDTSNTTANWDTGNHKVILNANNSYTTTDQTQYPTASRIKGLSFIDSNNGWAVSEGGSIVATTNGGTSWSRVGTISAYPSDIQMIDASTGYISSGCCADCCSGGAILKTTNGGATWSSLTLPAPVTQWKDNVLNLHFIDANTGWASRLSGQIIYTTNGGSSWTSQSVGATEHLSDVFFVNATTGWTVGYTGRIFKTTDSGSTWTEQTSGTSTQLRSVYFLNADKGWAVGQADAGGNVVALYTTNGGTAWTVVNVGEYGHDSANRVSFIDENNGYISGYAKTTNGGVTWTNVDKIPWLTNAFGLHVFDANTVIMGGDSGGIRKTTNAGTSWTYVLGPSDYPGSIVGLTMRTSSLGYAVNTFWDVFKTTNGGTNWSKVSSGYYSSAAPKDAIFVSDTVGIAVGSSGTIYKTTDSGVTWTQKSSGTTKNLNAVDFIDANNGIVVGNEGAVLVTVDGGETWTIKTSGTSANLNDVSYGDSSTVYAAGGSSVIKSANGGTTWSSLTISGFSVGSPVIFFIDANTGWVVGTTTVYKTTDGGTSWTTQSTGISGSTMMNDMFFLNSSEGWVVGEGGTVLRTSNGGSSWGTYSLGVNFNLGGIDFPSSSTTGWIGGTESFFAKLTAGSGTVYQTSNTIRSLSVDTTNDRIVSATLTATATLNGGTIAYYLSPDGGSHWESTTSGQSHTFTNMGQDLRWKAVLSTSNTSVTPELSNIAISYTDVPSNTAPTATVPTFSSQALDGTGYVTFSTQIDDPDDDNVKLKVEYSEDNGSTWKNPCLVSVTASSGTPGIQTCSNATYTMTRHPYSYNGNNYTFLDEDPDEGPNNGISIVYNNAGHPASEDILNVKTNNENITSTISSPLPTWNLGLIAIPGRNAYYTMYFKDSLFPTSATADTWCDSFMGTSCTVNFWADDVFVYSKSSGYVYTAPSGPTVLTTYQTGTPAINLSTTTNVPTGYQIGLPGLISTVSGGNTLTIVWNTKGVNGSSVITGEQNDIKIRVAPNDLMLTGTAQTSSAFSIDNLAPSGGLTTFAKSAVTSNSVTLNWNTVTETNFDVYEIWYGTTSGIEQNGVGLSVWDETDAANMETRTTTSATITGLKASTTYYFKIWAIDDYGNSLVSSEAQATTITTSIEAPVTGGSSGGGTISVGEVSGEETAEAGANAKNAEEEAKFTEELKPISVTVSLVETIQLPKAETGGAKVNPNAAEEAIKALETAPATETAATKETPLTQEEKNAEIVNVAISGGLTTAEAAVQITKAEKIINDVVQEAIKDAINSAAVTGGGGGGGIELTINDANVIKKITVKNLNDIEIKVSLGKDKNDENYQKQLAKDKEDALARGKELIIINETTNLDDDDIADAFAIANNIPLFNNDYDGDGRSTSEEIFLALNPLKADAAPLKPVITNMNGKVVLSGKDPISFRIAGKAGDKVKLALVPKKDREKILSLQQKSLYASILLSDIVTNINPSSRQVDLGSTVIDEHNQGELTVNKIIENGEYYVIAEGKYGVGPAAKFTVDNALDTATPKLNIVEYKRGLPYTIQMSLDLIEKIFKKFDKKAYILAYGGKDNLNARMYISGTADPGVTLYATWASRILSSVVLSDAKGNFEIDIPKKLAQGSHQVLVYAEKGGKVTAISGVTKLALIKK